MKREYDFSKGQRGKFFRPNTELNIPVYLEPDVARAFRSSAAVNKAPRSLLRMSETTRRLTLSSSGRAANARRAARIA
jgi:hypothetical protein